jgi:serine/threonine-protein kinase
MAPEQFHPGPNDARADVYALGCVLFAALTGAPPFLRETVPATMLAHLHDPPPRASDTPGVPRDFDRVLARALAKEPEDRYPSAGDLGRATLAAAEGRSVTEEERTVARGAAAPPPTRRREWAVPEPEPEPAPVKTYRSRGRPRWVFLGGAGALAAGALAFALFPGGDEVPPPGAPVTAGEVERLARAFASAYEDEDAARISRLITSDAQRVTPKDRQAGRAAVVAAYQSQFDASDSNFDIEDLEADGGPSGRATARYRTGSVTGKMTWNVIRERGRPRIVLISAVPD